MFSLLRHFSASRNICLDAKWSSQKKKKLPEKHTKWHVAHKACISEKAKMESDKLPSGVPFKEYSLKDKGIKFLDTHVVTLKANVSSFQFISYAYSCFI